MKVREGGGVRVGVADGIIEGVGVIVAVREAVGVTVIVLVGVAVRVAVPVRVGVCVWVGMYVTPARVGTGVRGVLVAARVGVRVKSRYTVAVGWRSGLGARRKRTIPQQ